jgi:hypothetical protein
VGILVEKDEERSDLQNKITADLRRRADENSLGEDLDLVEDSSYLDGMHKSTASTWFWGTLVFLAVLSLIVIFVLK